MQYTVAPLVFFAAFTATAGTAAHYYLNGTDGKITGSVASALGVEGQAISGVGTPDNGADDVGFDVGAAADMIPGVSPGSVMSLIPGLALGTMTGIPTSPFGALPVGRSKKRDRNGGREIGGDQPRGGGGNGDGSSGHESETTCRGDACGPGSQECFAGDTLVVTAEGLVAISSLDPDELVLTRTAPGQPLVERPITTVYETPNAPILEIGVAEQGGATEVLEVTTGHPFWIESVGWVDSDELAPGDELTTADGDAAHVVSVATTDRRVTVYNLQIEEHHTYFVGDTMAWVHNMGNCVSRRRPTNEELITAGGPNSRDVFDAYEDGSGFSGAYDPDTGRWVGLASGGNARRTDGQAITPVDQFGGHADAQASLGSRNGRNDVGFVLVKRSGGELEIRWNSRTINERNFGDRGAPARYRDEIKAAIEAQTGYRVVEP